MFKFKPTDILDTLVFKDGRIFLKQYHAQRTLEAYKFLSALLNQEDVFSLYDQIENKFKNELSNQHILRLIFSKDDPLQVKCEIKSIETIKLDNQAALQLEICSNLQQNSGQKWSNYKWIDRNFWNSALSSMSRNACDILMTNELDQITETSRFNLFLYSPLEDLVYTPTLSSGCLNGVYRRYALANMKINLPNLGIKTVVEKDIKKTELTNFEIFVANSVREVLKAELI